MNDGIKALAEKATVSIPYRICPHTYKHIDDPEGILIRKEFDQEKFAELIVKDCLSIVDEVCNAFDSPEWRICEHFGIDHDWRENERKN